MKNNKAIKSISSLLVISTLLTSMAGCSKNDKKVSISNDTTIEEVLESISEISEFDEILVNAKFDNETLNEMLEKYREARSAKDASLCNEYLYRLCMLLVRTTAVKELGIEYEQLVGINYEEFNKEEEQYLLTAKYNVDKSYVAAGNIPVENIIEEQAVIITDGELSNLIINLNKARLAIWKLPEDASENEPTIDDVYKSLIRFLLTKENQLKDSKSEEAMYYCNLNLDNEKVKKLNK